MQRTIEHIVADIADSVVPALVAAAFTAENAADCLSAGNVRIYIAVFNDRA